MQRHSQPLRLQLKLLRAYLYCPSECMSNALNRLLYGKHPRILTLFLLSYGNDYQTTRNSRLFRVEAKQLCEEALLLSERRQV